jgi:hypothetical protein
MDTMQCARTSADTVTRDLFRANDMVRCSRLRISSVASIFRTRMMRIDDCRYSAACRLAGTSYDEASKWSGSGAAMSP